MGWKVPTPIQIEGIPPALEGRDIIGLAKTGSGKTGAFTLPVLHRLLATPQGMFALMVSPTRELAFQIAEQVRALGRAIGVTAAVLVGGVDPVQQALQLAKRPHIVVGTPGRIVYHLHNTKGFQFGRLRVLVLDEADRLLSQEYVGEVNTILGTLPKGKERQTMLYSATMTDNVSKLLRTSLQDPVKVHVANKYSTNEALKQQMVFCPDRYKDLYLLHLLEELRGARVILFMDHCHRCALLSVALEHLGFSVTALHGKMKQSSRRASLDRFMKGERQLLVATDVAARGLDIPTVDVVLNYVVPTATKTYVHRVGRTARAHRAGRAVTFVTQYDMDVFQHTESQLSIKMESLRIDKEEVMMLEPRFEEAKRLAADFLRDHPELVDAALGKTDPRKEKKRKEPDGMDQYHHEAKKFVSSDLGKKKYVDSRRHQAKGQKKGKNQNQKGGKKR